MSGKTVDVTHMDSLKKAVGEVLSIARGNAGDRATVLALSGDLGAGKTTFTQELAKTLGISEAVTSPTFVIMKKYSTNDGHFQTLVHIDAYRLEDEAELEVLGFKDELISPRNLIVIEWPEKVSGLVPKDAIGLRLTIDADKRLLEIK